MYTYLSDCLGEVMHHVDYVSHVLGVLLRHRDALDHPPFRLVWRFQVPELYGVHRLAGGESSWGILAACILSGAPSKTRRRGAHLLDSINNN